MSEQTQLDEQEWLTTNQVAEIYGITKKTVYRWSYEKKVTSKLVDRDLYLSRSSIDTMLEQQEEEKKHRGSALGQMRRTAAAVPTVSDQGEVARLTKQLQDSTYENGRLKGSVEVYEKELGRLHTLIKDLVVQPR